jgi:ATP-dependent Lhr-like helicase
VQRIGLSATVGNPKEVLDWFAGDRRPKEVVAVPAPPKEKRFTFTVEPDEEKRMGVLAGTVRGKKALVFVNSRADAERVAKALRGKGGEPLGAPLVPVSPKCGGRRSR